MPQVGVVGLAIDRCITTAGIPEVVNALQPQTLAQQELPVAVG